MTQSRVCNNYKTSTSTSKTLEQSHLLKQSVLFLKFHNKLVNCNIPESVSSHRKSKSTRRHQLCYQQLHVNVLSFNYS